MRPSSRIKSPRAGFSSPAASKVAQEETDHRERVFAEYEKASARIGTSEADQVRWLLNLAQTDVEALSSGDVTNRAFEMAAFARWGGTKEGRTIASEGTGKHAATDYSTYYSQEEIDEHRQSLKKHIDRLLKTGHTRFELSNVSVDIGSLQGVPYFLVSSPSAFEYRAANLLAPHAHRIRQCSACQRIFLAVRNKQKWCSTRCQSRMGTQRFREKLEEKPVNKREKRLSLIHI